MLQSDKVDKETLAKIDAGYQRLQSDAKCKSLLKKHLTKDVRADYIQQG